MKKFYKNLLNAICFIAGLLILLVLSSFYFEPKGNGKEDGMIDSSANGILSEPKNTIDVVFLGDSETYNAFMPLYIWEQEGITSYCCGTAGQLLSYTESFLEKSFKKQSPKIVVLETNTIYRKVSFNKAVQNKAESVFSVFTFHDRWKSMKLNDIGFAVKYTYIDGTKGYQYSNIIEPADSTGYMTPSDDIESFSGLNKKYVESISSFCKKNGAELILVSTPSTVNWRYERHNAIQNLADELGIEYIDMNLRPEIEIDWSLDTRDGGDHMNYTGAQKVSGFLAKYFAETGLCENHKEDESYEAWNEALENFKKIVDKM